MEAVGNRTLYLWIEALFNETTIKNDIIIHTEGLLSDIHVQLWCSQNE